LVLGYTYSLDNLFYQGIIYFSKPKYLPFSLGDFHFLKTKTPMKQNFDSIVDELKFHLRSQIEAYHQEDWDLYEQLEERILELEGKL